MQPEARLTKKILDALNTLPGSYFRKVWSGRASSGWPDVIGCYAGVMYAIEVKRPEQGYGVTKLQAAELDKWAKAGAQVAVVTSVQEALDVVIPGTKV